MIVHVESLRGLVFKRCSFIFKYKLFCVLKLELALLFI